MRCAVQASHNGIKRKVPTIAWALTKLGSKRRCKGKGYARNQTTTPTTSHHERSLTVAVASASICISPPATAVTTCVSIYLLLSGLLPLPLSGLLFLCLLASSQYLYPLSFSGWEGREQGGGRESPLQLDLPQHGLQTLKPQAHCHQWNLRIHSSSPLS